MGLASIVYLIDTYLPSWRATVMHTLSPEVASAAGYYAVHHGAVSPRRKPSAAGDLPTEPDCEPPACIMTGELPILVCSGAG